MQTSEIICKWMQGDREREGWMWRESEEAGGGVVARQSQRQEKEGGGALTLSIPVFPRRKVEKKRDIERLLSVSIYKQVHFGCGSGFI